MTRSGPGFAVAFRLVDVWGIVALVAGWLVGSISGARVVAARVVPGVPLSPTRVVLDDRGNEAITTGVSSSMLGARAGSRAGGLAALIDIAKGFVPVVVAQVATDAPAVVGLTAIGVVLGHVVPLGHVREGGYGMSTMIGVALAVDPLGLAVVITVAIVVAALAGSPYLGSELWLVLLPVWFWIDGEPWLAVATGLCALLYAVRGWSEYRPAWQSWRTDPRPWFGRWSDYWEYPIYEPIE